MRAIVDDALECVAVECPDAYRAMQETLGGRRIELAFEGESFTLTLADTEAITASERSVRIRTTARIVHDILMGELEPIQAILADALMVHAHADDLVAAAEAGLFFAKGAARCTSMDSMMMRLRALVAGAPPAGEEH